MPFQEKSAWIMSLALLVGGAFYVAVVTSMSSATGQLATPNVPVLAIYTLILIMIAVIGHIAISIMSPREASAPVDEREQKIFNRAGHASSNVLAAGVIISLGLYLLTHSGDLLFYGVFASLMIGQIAEYAIQIYLYRAGI